ncbi:MAG: galactose mutarotase [Firmicutes bacterium]|nr:galactose mutarotase [Bacillota bacterium]
MPIVKTEYGKAGDKTVYCYTLDNGGGLSAEIINYGGIIKNLYFNDKNGVKTDVVLGRDTLDDYFKNDGYLGALIGRHANRIAGGKFTIDGREYNAGINENGNSLHGGNVGFDKKVWDAEESGTDAEPSLVLSLLSPDGEEGFPGNLKVRVTYTLTADNALKIEYSAVSDKDTVVNLTNHSYFNLAGYNSGTLKSQTLYINSSFYTPNDSACMPTGEVLSVEGTAFDFREAKELTPNLDAPDAQVQMFGGFDHNFVIDGEGYRLAARAECADNGIVMETRTNQPSMQLYTSNGLPEGEYKNGSHCGVHSAFCLETQCFPNAMKYRHYPNPLLRAGEEYKTVTEYKFSVK